MDTGSCLEGFRIDDLGLCFMRRRVMGVCVLDEVRLAQVDRMRVRV